MSPIPNETVSSAKRRQFKSATTYGEYLMTSLLNGFSEFPPPIIPFFFVASAFAGINIAITAAEEGNRVLVVARPHLHPPQLVPHMNLLTIIDQEFSRDNLRSINDKLSSEFDLIVFVRDIQAFDGDAKEDAEEVERLLTEMHLNYLAGSSGRCAILRPEGYDAFYEERAAIELRDSTASVTARQTRLH
jgi:hypothetical protein